MAIAASANASFTTLTRLSSPLPNANSSYATNPIAVYLDPPAGNASILSLPPGDSLTIPNRAISKNKTVPGNILQCLHNITSDQPYEPGQFPLAAIDGSISTNWQPSLASAPAALTIDTSTIPFQPLIAFEFNWAAQPPKNATVLLSNSSSPPVTTSSGVIFVPVPHIAISNPYNASTANRVGPYQSNTTTVNLTGQTIWSGKWATLVVEGNANDDSAAAVGATVAEFALIGRK
ncbi:MAG: hypothetical protein LQ340_002053 [Diploschistes diacapsis]|nr:MAG: hypothetical protein LQ340_002053 [Diploschistes diacapsis]